MKTLLFSRHMQQLEHAKEIRSKRSALKRHMRSGTTALSWVLRADKGYVQTMALRQILIATPKIGKVKVDRLLAALNFSPTVQLQHVSMQRREEVLDYIAEHFPAVAT